MTVTLAVRRTPVKTSDTNGDGGGSGQRLRSSRLSSPLSQAVWLLFEPLKSATYPEPASWSAVQVAGEHSGHSEPGRDGPVLMRKTPACGSYSGHGYPDRSAGSSVRKQKACPQSAAARDARQRRPTHRGGHSPAGGATLLTVKTPSEAGRSSDGDRCRLPESGTEGQATPHVGRPGPAPEDGHRGDCPCQQLHSRARYEKKFNAQPPPPSARAATARVEARRTVSTCSPGSHATAFIAAFRPPRIFRGSARHPQGRHAW